MTAGLLDALGRDELQAVIAHEMSHVRNYDIRLLTVVAALVGAIALISDWTMRGIAVWRRRAEQQPEPGRRGRRRRKPPLPRSGSSPIILAPFIGQLLAMMVSRNREYLADASAAEMTRNPLALAGALDEGRRRRRADALDQAGHREPLHRRSAGAADREKEGRWANLMASHPPIDKRVEALRGMSYIGPEG